MKHMIKMVALGVAVMGSLAFAAAAQNQAGGLQPDSDDTGYAFFDVTSGQTRPGGEEMDRYGNLVYNNNGYAHTWWPIGYGNLDYIMFDWGALYTPTGTGLPDEIIDGFSFRYTTTDQDTAGLDIDIHFYDDTTGFNNLGTMEALFTFTGLPNALGKPPGSTKNWVITVDLEGTGQEFLLGQEIGWAHVYHNGCDPTDTIRTGPGIGTAPLLDGNGPTGTRNRFDIYYPNSVYQGTYYFGGPTPWATWPIRLWGGKTVTSTYYGQTAQGNNARLYQTGEYFGGSKLRFMMRDFTQLPSYLLISLQYQNSYLSSLDITRLVGSFLAGTPASFPMQPDANGWFERVSVQLPGSVPPAGVFFQGISANLANFPPIDASNGIRMK